MGERLIEAVLVAANDRWNHVVVIGPSVMAIADDRTCASEVWRRSAAICTPFDVIRVVRIGTNGRERNPAHVAQWRWHSIDTRMTFGAQTAAGVGAEPDVACGAAGRIKKVDQIMQHRRVSIVMKRCGAKLKWVARWPHHVIHLIQFIAFYGIEAPWTHH